MPGPRFKTLIKGRMVRYQDVVDVAEREQCKCGPRGSVSCYQICVKNGQTFAPGQNSVTDGADGTSLECDCLEGGEWSCAIKTSFSSSSSSSQRYPIKLCFRDYHRETKFEGTRKSFIFKILISNNYSKIDRFLLNFLTFEYMGDLRLI